ncbi:hypothetical protein BsWGS_21079 [Bradybaena similaris]
MPHMSLEGSEDFYSTDEVKVYKDEGNKDEEERCSSENLSEEKLGLVTESEEGKSSSLSGNFSEKSNTATDDEASSSAPLVPAQGPPGAIGFFLPHYASPYTNGSSMAGKFSMVQPSYPGLVMYNAQPPPAHKGFSPVYHDPKTGLARPPVYAAYPAPHGQFPHPLYSPEFSSASWHRPHYPLTSGAFAGSFPPSLTSLSCYGPAGILPHPGLTHPGIPHPASLGPGPKSELMSPQLLQETHRQLNSLHRDENSICKPSPHHNPGTGEDTRKRPYVKKPLNAFMLFMKEMRPKVISECTLKESAAINQILGRRWHALDRAEQAKYYEMARKEKEVHLQRYPGWSARDNYAAHQKKKKRKKEGHGGGSGNNLAGMESGGAGMSPMSSCSGMSGGSPHAAVSVDTENKSGDCPNERKCRARYGIEQQSRWCKPCRRKKKCIRYKYGCGEDEQEQLEDYLLINQSLDSSLMSGCESDSSNPVTSPVPEKHGPHLTCLSDVDDKAANSSDSAVVNDKAVMNSQFALITMNTLKREEPENRLFQPLPYSFLSPGAPATSSQLQQPLRRLTTHTVDSFLFPPSTLCLPYHLPPSPLSLPVTYIGYPFHHQRGSSPGQLTPGGFPMSLNTKPELD